MEVFNLEPAPDRRQLIPTRGRLVIVDAHGHAFRAFWALEPMHAPDGLPTNALFGLAGLLRRLVYEEQPDFIAVVFDAPDEVRRTFRTGLYPLYKAHRPERPADLALQIPVLRDVARACGLTTLEHPDYEADDLVATIVAAAEAANIQTTIMSADKDLLQLVSDRTQVWDAMRGKRYTHAAVEEKLGVGPGLVADYLALCGDASDNVPGVPGIGPRSAARLLRAHGSLDALYRLVDESPAAIPTRERNKLIEHRERAFLSQSLTRLRNDVPVSIDLAGLAGLRRPEVPREIGHALWARLGFMSFLPDGARLPEVLPAVVAPPQALPHSLDLALAGTLDPAGPVRPPATLDVHDLKGLSALLAQARAAAAIGLALMGGSEEPTRAAKAQPRMTRRAEHAYVPPVLGLALPSGASWRISLQGGQRGLPGRVVQGSLFGGEPDMGGAASPATAVSSLTITDVAAGMASLLADPKRVVCVHDAARLSLLGIAPGRVANVVVDIAGDDPTVAAVEVLSAWMAGSA